MAKEVKKSSKKKKILLGTLIPVGVLGAMAGAGVGYYANNVSIYFELTNVDGSGNRFMEGKVDKLAKFGVMFTQPSLEKLLHMTKYTFFKMTKK